MKSNWGRAGAAGAMVVAVAATVNLFGAPSGAQQDVALPIVVTGSDSAPAISDDGNIVAFRSVDANGAASITVHNRTASTITKVPGGPFGAELGDPSISGNGCVVAYPISTDAAEVAFEVEAAPRPGTSGEIRVVDRCLDPAQLIELVPIEIAEAPQLSSPALSLDGAVLAVSTGQEVARYVRSESSYAVSESFDGPTAVSQSVLTADGLDISDDGGVVVFASGTDSKTLSTMTVNSWTVGVVTALESGAWSPKVSGNGRVVVFQAPVGVMVRDRTTPGALAVSLAPGAESPEISADGYHVVVEAGADVRVISWIGQGLAPFDATSSRVVAGAAAPSDSGAVIDRLGATVAVDSKTVGDGFAERDIVVSSSRSTAGFSSQSFDLGVGDIGAVLTTTATFTNDGPVSIGVASVTVDAPFTIGENGCLGSIRPQSTCSVVVSTKIERYEDAFGVLSFNVAGSGAPYTAEVVVLGKAGPTTTSTTIPGTTTTTTTTGGATGGTTTGGTTGSTGGRPTTTSTTGGRPTSTTSTTGGRPTTPATTAPPPPGAGITFSPAAFDFAPTIIGAGRRTGSIEILNSSARSVSINDVRLEPAAVPGSGPFEIASTTCTDDPVPANGRCSVDLAFAPTELGTQSAQLTVGVEGGTDLSATVSGTGAPAPTLTVIPGVASVGQVATISGGGFPTGVSVAISWGDDVVPILVTVDDTGAFKVPVIVRPHTPTGPISVVVAAQADLFAEVATTMLVTDTSSRTSPGVLNGVGPSLGR
jgi:hypothetical protein